MKELEYINDSYLTESKKPSIFSALIPSILFYIHFVIIVIKAARLSKAGIYDDKAWSASSLNVLRRLEMAGISLSISGIENIRQTEGPCVIIGNHMSMMETLLLPTILLRFKPITFVIKESLLNYPIFKHVMRACHPIAVSRTNPRQDLKTVMQEGVAKLKEGRSVIVFPQTTRAHVFDPAQMSSIGVKLAKKAGVPVIPLALKTDSWTNGSMAKDFGRLDTSKQAHFAFGEPLIVEGKGTEEHEIINQFISGRLNGW